MGAGTWVFGPGKGQLVCHNGKTPIGILLLGQLAQRGQCPENLPERLGEKY